jgi:hypothetical protein
MANISHKAGGRGGSGCHIVVYLEAFMYCLKVGPVVCAQFVPAFVLPKPRRRKIILLVGRYVLRYGIGNIAYIICMMALEHAQMRSNCQIQILLEPHSCLIEAYLKVVCPLDPSDQTHTWTPTTCYYLTTCRRW